MRGLPYRLLLVAITIVAVSILAGVMTFALTGSFTIPEAIWWAFLRLTDPGYLGDDRGLAQRIVSTIVTILGYVFLSWTPAMLARVFQWSPADIGLGYGIVLFFSGPLGVIAGGWIADYLYKKGNKDAHLLTVLIGLALVNTPFGIVAPIVPNPIVVLALLFV